MPIQKYDYEEMILLRILELNPLQPHYWSELILLANQLLGPEEKAIMLKITQRIEGMVLEEEVMVNVYVCNSCEHKWKTMTDWFNIEGCPKCKHKGFECIQNRQSFYDIETLMENSIDMTAYFERYGDKVTKFAIERILNQLKSFIFERVRIRSEKKRFKRFK